MAVAARKVVVKCRRLGRSRGMEGGGPLRIRQRWWDDGLGKRHPLSSRLLLGRFLVYCGNQSVDLWRVLAQYQANGADFLCAFLAVLDNPEISADSPSYPKSVFQRHIWHIDVAGTNISAIARPGNNPLAHFVAMSVFVLAWPGAQLMLNLVFKIGDGR